MLSFLLSITGTITEKMTIPQTGKIFIFREVPKHVVCEYLRAFSMF